MRTVKLMLEKNNTTLVNHCWVAERFQDRLVGLLGRESISSDTALLILPCNSVHSFFMRFNIDVIYLQGDKKLQKFRILSVRRAMRPWRMHWPVFGATAVLEMSEGKSAELAQGDILCIS